MYGYYAKEGTGYHEKKSGSKMIVKRYYEEDLNEDLYLNHEDQK
jgi:hypothetical protein